MAESDSLPATQESRQLLLPEPQQKMFQQFLELQKLEYDVKLKEMEVAKQQNADAVALDQAALQAQASDRQNQRQFILQYSRNSYTFCLLCGVLIVGLIVGALAMNKDQVAFEIIKAILYLGAGGVGGYAIGKKGKPEDHAE